MLHVVFKFKFKAQSLEEGSGEGSGEDSGGFSIPGLEFSVLIWGLGLGFMLHFAMVHGSKIS